MNPPRRPMRPTTPTTQVETADTPAAKPASAGFEPIVDWKQLAIDLMTQVETRSPIRLDLEPSLSAIRAAAGMEPRLADKAPASAPATLGLEGAPRGAVRVTRIYFNAAGEEMDVDGAIVPDFLRYEAEASSKAGSEKASSSLPGSDEATEVDFFSTEHSQAAAEADAQLGRLNYERISANHERLIDEGKMRRRLPMKSESSS